MRVSGTLRQIDLFSEDFIQDPHPTYRELRQNNPVYYHQEWKGWLITRYDHVKRVLNNTTVFTSRKLTSLLGGSQQTTNCPFAKLTRWMSYQDPPEQKTKRQWISNSLPTDWLSMAGPYADDVTERYLDKIEGAGTADLLNGFAKPIVQSVIDRLFKIPSDISDTLRNGISDFLEFTSGVNPKAREKAEDAIQTMEGLLRELIRSRPEGSSDDLLSRLVRQANQVPELDEDDVVHNTINLLTAGYESTGHLIANGLYTLLRNPTQYDRLVKDPGLTEQTVEEILRYRGVFEALSRRTTDSVTIGSTTVPKGDRVTVILASANRDPRKFDSPEQFDVTRDPNHHLGFGSGSHFCPGAGLARVLARIVIEKTVRDDPEMTLLEDGTEWEKSFVTRVQKECPVSLG